MAVETTLDRARSNRILAALPRPELERCLPHLERVVYPIRQVLHAPGEPITAVHFPESGWISMLAVLADGGAAEVGLIGREGVVGLPLFFGTDRSPAEAMWQSGSVALRMSAEAFREATAEGTTLRSLVLRYAMCFTAQVSQTAACNGRHSIEQRLARWVLVAHDRDEADEFPITHEFLSMMLGVRRAGVTVVAGRLQKAGLIRYRKGLMTVTDRAGLEAHACECYGVVRREYDRLLGPGWRARRD